MGQEYLERLIVRCAALALQVLVFHYYDAYNTPNSTVTQRRKELDTN